MRRRLLAAAFLLAGLALAGCGDVGLTATATEVPGAAATAARRAATPIPTPIRTPTAPVPPSPLPRPSPTSGPSDEEQIAAAVDAIAKALDSGNLDALRDLMIDQVAIAPGGDQGAETMDRDLALSWLRERAGPGPKVVSSDVVENFGLLEVHTEPWETKPPVSSGKVQFNLHRYNDQGDQDPIHGQWKIDVLIPQ